MKEKVTKASQTFMAEHVEKKTVKVGSHKLKIKNKLAEGTKFRHSLPNEKKPAKLFSSSTPQPSHQSELNTFRLTNNDNKRIDD